MIEDRSCLNTCTMNSTQMQTLYTLETVFSIYYMLPWLLRILENMNILFCLFLFLIRKELLIQLSVIPSCFCLFFFLFLQNQHKTRVFLKWMLGEVMKMSVYFWGLMKCDLTKYTQKFSNLLTHAFERMFNVASSSTFVRNRHILWPLNCWEQDLWLWHCTSTLRFYVH